MSIPDYPDLMARNRIKFEYFSIFSVKLWFFDNSWSSSNIDNKEMRLNNCTYILKLFYRVVSSSKELEDGFKELDAKKYFTSVLKGNVKKNKAYTDLGSEENAKRSKQSHLQDGRFGGECTTKYNR